jgi:hypothetical protein
MSASVQVAGRPLPYPTQDQKRRKLRVAIVTENFLPKVDGVTRTLARLLEHLNQEGHEAIVFGPETGLVCIRVFQVYEEAVADNISSTNRHTMLDIQW